MKKAKGHQGSLYRRYCFKNSVFRVYSIDSNYFPSSFFQMSVVIFFHLWSLILKHYVFTDDRLVVKVPVSGNLWSIFIVKLHCFNVNKKQHFILNISQLFGKTSTPCISKTKKTGVNLNGSDFAILDNEFISSRAKITIFGLQILIKSIDLRNFRQINYPKCYRKLLVQVK